MAIHKGKQAKARRILIYGEPGVGKSTLASQFPRPVFLNLEDGIRDLDCDHTDQIRTTKEFMQYLVAELPASDYATIAIDTVDWLEKLLMHDVAQKAGKATIEDIGFGKGYQTLAKHWQDVFVALSHLWNQGRHIVFTCHATIDRFADPEGDGYNYYRPSLHKSGSVCVTEWCDEVLFCRYSRSTKKADDGKRTIALQGERVIICNNMQAIEAKNRLGMPDELPMNIESFKRFMAKPDVKPATSVVASVKETELEESVTF